MAAEQEVTPETLPTSRGHPVGRLAVALASLAVLLAAADTYVVVLTLPDMMAGVGLSADELHRGAPLVSAFLLGYVTTLPLVGRLADIRGRVPVLVGCLVIFSIGSLLTATADGLGVAVAGRALQGVGGGGLVPATLALVADVWPPHRRGLPLGVVGALQEFGSVLGPLYGAALLELSGWRAIFWVNLAAGLVVAAALAGEGRRHRPGGRAVSEVSPRFGFGRALLRWGLPAATVACLGVASVRPAALVDSVVLGSVFVPMVGEVSWTSPVAVAGVLLVVLTVVVRSVLAGVRRPYPWRLVDLTGAALLAVTLGGIVLAFAAADPSRQAIADSAPVLLAGSALAGMFFLVRQRRAAHPLIPAGALAAPSAWGALLVNLFVGAALVVALIDVPIFARATEFPDSQLGAALVLLQLLAALSVGALAGGWLLARFAPGWLASGGLAAAAVGLAAMARWDEQALSGPAAPVALVVTGLGFGLAVAPVNAALLAATKPAQHGIASALSVVARMVGMLTGLSVLTALGLRVFYRDQARIGTPLQLCPASPDECPAYEIATRSALVHELSVMFTGAALCAAVAAVLALALLGRGRRLGKE